jgi:hypothetical protein
MKLSHANRWKTSASLSVKVRGFQTACLVIEIPPLVSDALGTGPPHGNETDALEVVLVPKRFATF